MSTLETKSTLETSQGNYTYYSLKKLQALGYSNIEKLPYSVKILLESVLRNCGNGIITEEDVTQLAQWQAQSTSQNEVAFYPARVLLQDLTGVPAMVDLAALRSAMARLGGDPNKINPLIPSDLVIDHSVQVDEYGSSAALLINSQKEFKRNRERYEFLRWGADAFDNFRAVPPATGIVHQVNLEYFGQIVQSREINGEQVAFPDTLIGLDSHTTMINGLGIIGWGVGGIEAEAVMLGQAYYLLTPKIVGCKLSGQLQEGVTATDLVLTITQMLREHGVVGKFVEFYGPGLDHLSLADRATIANMAPEYGATMGFFPVDKETLNYLTNTGRKNIVELVEKYTKEQGIFRTAQTPDPIFSETLELNLADVQASLAGPRKPQERIELVKMRETFDTMLDKPRQEGGYDIPSDELTKSIKVELNNNNVELKHGSVLIAAITSCTNTSNPSVMIGAALLAKKAVEKGLEIPSYVKTSLAPGSKVVQKYLEKSGLLPYLEKLGFHIVGFGCTSCIGNSGPLPEPLDSIVNDNNLIVTSVSSGNRNFEGRISPTTKANYLASPPLVIAYALAGRTNINLNTDPLGSDQTGNDIFLKDIWPSQKEIQETVRQSLDPQMFKEQYANVFDGNEEWNNIPIGKSDLYPWNENSTYIQEPSFFENLEAQPPAIQNIEQARVLVVAGDGTTTDHISPAGAIASNSPAADYLRSKGIERKDFNTYGSRRGNHEVMMRGTFANVRFRNQLTPEIEGTSTIYFPSQEQMNIYDASLKYKADNTDLIVLAGKDYGMGSSRDWAAKGQYLLGVKAVIFDTVERIHRSNLIGMGVLPLQFADDENYQSLGLSGEEVFDITGLDNNLQPGQKLSVTATTSDGNKKEFIVQCRLDSPIEIEYYRHGGILQYVLRKLLRG